MSEALVPRDPGGESGLVRRSEAPPVRYVRRALTHPIHVGAVAALVGAAISAGTPLVLAVGAVLELAYLAVVPRLRVFREAVDAKRRKARRVERERLEQEIYEGLSPNQQATVDALRELRAGIERNYARLGRGMPAMASQSLAQVDVLLSSFLRLLDQLNAYRRHLGATGRLRLEKELEAVRKDVAGEESERIKELKERRVRILERRLERYAKGEENREVISHQLAAIDDLLRLVHEQSLTLRDPSDVSRLLDSLEAEVEETEQTVREMESFLSLQEEMEAIDRMAK